jgi:hypothetical protein
MWATSWLPRSKLTLQMKTREPAREIVHAGRNNTVERIDFFSARGGDAQPLLFLAAIKKYFAGQD